MFKIVSANTRTTTILELCFLVAITAQKMKFSIKDFVSKYDILNGKLHFLCSVYCQLWTSVACNFCAFIVEFKYIFRSSRSTMIFKIGGALKNFAIFTGKHLCWSLFEVLCWSLFWKTSVNDSFCILDSSALIYCFIF